MSKRIVPGHKAKLRIGGPNGAVIAFQEGTLNMSSDEIDSTDTEGGGFTDTDAGASKMTISVKGLWNAAENPHASPLHIRNGMDIANVYVFIEGALAFHGPLMKITSVNLNIPVRNGVMLDFQMTNKGPFSYPGG